MTPNVHSSCLIEETLSSKPAIDPPTATVTNPVIPVETTPPLPSYDDAYYH